MGMDVRTCGGGSNLWGEEQVIRVSQLKMPLVHTEEDLLRGLKKMMRISGARLLRFEILKRSLDARKPEDIHYTYTIDVCIADETDYLKKNRDKNIARSTTVVYKPPKPEGKPLRLRPVVCGSGPAGMFCAYFLAQAGYCPIILERGEAVEERSRTVERFFAGGALNTESNVQFGEGGAGTFSDGKLNTMVKDTYGRIRKVLEVFVQAGAPEEILYQNKPHIGTDRLRTVVAAMREQIKAWGGEFCFGTKLVDIRWASLGDASAGFGTGKLAALTPDGTGPKQGKLFGLVCRTGEREWELATQQLVLAVGHSARDTFSMLLARGLLMEPKPFAVGVRVEHGQDFINRVQYKAAADKLGAADYKLTYTAGNGRGIYSFCMCPGGFVVNASSEQGHLVVNGMSYHDRAGSNANSALVVTVTPEDFASACVGGVADYQRDLVGSVRGSADTGMKDFAPAVFWGGGARMQDPLSGIAFQRHFEALAYQAAQGKIPYQLYGDLLCGRAGSGYGRIIPCHKGAAAPADLRGCLPEFVTATLLEGMKAFDRTLPGFADEEAVFSGVEMRTSSPVRILRDGQYESSIEGVYPCGEGAGYAGGIMSAAVDGIKVFEAIAARFFPEFS